MRDGILLCRGKGNERWNESSAHGSGRMITRQKAIKNKVAIGVEYLRGGRRGKKKLD